MKKFLTINPMNIEAIREYCLSKPGVTEGFPFNDTALVFKVGGKMFALLDLSEEARGITLKCDPELAVALREQHLCKWIYWMGSSRLNPIRFLLWCSIIS